MKERPLVSTTGPGTRTPNPLIKSQLTTHTKNTSKSLSENTLQASLRPSKKAVVPNKCQTDPALARLIEAWPSLSESLRKAVLAIVQSAEPGAEGAGDD